MLDQRFEVVVHHGGHLAMMNILNILVGKQLIGHGIMIDGVILKC